MKRPKKRKPSTPEPKGKYPAPIKSHYRRMGRVKR